ncbi:SDR family oxidoreductase [Cytobacillus sp. Hz8]|uniref:SDR family oxidoreductase n=1 Tax=Cytobacillus sp. Hz8 TaxID=3347168 RepID=UPI0035DA21AB
MANTYFFTGFPGFIATSLIKKIMTEKDEINQFYLLVQPQFLQKAEETLRKIALDESLLLEQFTIIPGDITLPDLGMDAAILDELKGEITHVFHLAAIYDLAVPEELAIKVNINGTKNVNDWLLTLHNVQRYVYFSTSYIAGTREGRILESELDKHQSFKNYYERTKFEAEVLVRQIISKVPTTIIRPGIVVGNSQTGDTIKFDGLYFILNFFDKLKFLPIIPYLGAGKAEGNFVPVDYIFAATIYLGHADIGIGKTYQLTDPNPYRCKEVYHMLMKEYLGREPFGVIPLGLAKWFLSFSAIRKWLRVEKEALDYFTCMAEYDCSQTQKDLKGSGITCPNFKDVIPAMVLFFKQHKNDSEKQVKIQ